MHSSVLVRWSWPACFDRENYPPRHEFDLFPWLSGLSSSRKTSLSDSIDKTIDKWTKFMINILFNWSSWAKGEFPIRWKVYFRSKAKESIGSKLSLDRVQLKIKSFERIGWEKNERRFFFFIFFLSFFFFDKITIDVPCFLVPKQRRLYLASSIWKSEHWETKSKHVDSENYWRKKVE